jgi:Na+/H+ antiporter NhaC
METIQVIGILAVFAIMVALMMARKLPTLLALPIMAIIMALIAGVPVISTDDKAYTIAKDVLELGSMRMSTAISGLIFGSIFGKVLSKIGVTEAIIKKAAELAGDRTLAISLGFLAVSSIIFAASNGLGMVILVGTIIIPIMISAGLTPTLSGIILLLANGIGVTFSVSTLAVYIDVLKLPLSTVTKWSWICGIPLILIAIIMIIFFVKFSGKKRRAWAMPNGNMNKRNKQVRTIALISPVVPVVLVFAFKMPLVISIIIGIIVALLLSTPKKSIHVVSSSAVEGIQDVAGAIGLMMGIGMLLNSVMAPQVAQILKPAIELIVPQNQLMFILIFGLLSPLAIYRGPLNVWGLGSGILTLLVAGGMNPIAAMVALRLDSNVQAVCDPTNSQNVWVADFTKTDVNEILKKTLLWLAASTLIGLVVASFMLY